MALPKNLRLLPNVILIVTEPYVLVWYFSDNPDEEYSLLLEKGDALIYKKVVPPGDSDILELFHCRTATVALAYRNTVYSICKLAPLKVLGTKTGRREAK